MSRYEYRTSWKSRLGCVGAGLAVFLAPIAAYALWAMTPPLPLTQFDADRWRSVERSNDFARQEMVGSLIWSRQLEGMTRQEVERMLGPDCGCSYFSDWDLVYWMGNERSWLSLDSEWLVIRFDNSGRFAEYAIVTD
jgi:hypothetical protein